MADQWIDLIVPYTIAFDQAVDFGADKPAVAKHSEQRHSTTDQTSGAARLSAVNVYRRMLRHYAAVAATSRYISSCPYLTPSLHRSLRGARIGGERLGLQPTRIAGWAFVKALGWDWGLDALALFHRVDEACMQGAWP